jgi:hypothetical protein
MLSLLVVRNRTLVGVLCCGSGEACVDAHDQAVQADASRAPRDTAGSHSTHLETCEWPIQPAGMAAHPP